MNFSNLIRAFDALMALREAAKRLKGGDDVPPRASELASTAASAGLGGQIEARLTNVVVAALKEAFDRDHARLELERTQVDEQRRRAEAAMRMELRRQAADREIGRLRLLAATAFAGWIASVLLLVVRLGDVSLPSRIVVAVGWLLLLAGLAAAFSAQGRIGTYVADESHPLDTAATPALWLVVLGLATSAASLLF